MTLLELSLNDALKDIRDTLPNAFIKIKEKLKQCEILLDHDGPIAFLITEPSRDNLKINKIGPILDTSVQITKPLPPTLATTSDSPTLVDSNGASETRAQVVASALMRKK